MSVAPPLPSAAREPFARRAARRQEEAGALFVALENHFNPTVAVSGSLRAGIAYSPPDNPMLALVASGMLDKGTRRRSKLALAEELEGRGASVSFSVDAADPLTLDISAASLSRDYDRLVGALVEMLTEPGFPEEELAREKERLLGALKQQEDSTSWRASSEASRLVYPPGHPYNQPEAARKRKAVSSTTRDELCRFYEGLYGAATLVLAVVGDIDRDFAVEDLRRRLSAWASGGRPAIPSVPELAAGPQQRLLPMKDKPNVDAVLVRHGGLARNDPDYIAATLGNAALGQSTLSSRLGLRLRDTEGLTYGINSRFLSTHVAGPFVISLTVAPQNLSRAVASTRQVLERYLEEGITEKEMREEKQSRVGKFKVDLASNHGIASALDTVESYGLGIDYLDRFADLVFAVSRDEINDAIRRHVRTDDLVMVAAGEL